MRHVPIVTFANECLTSTGHLQAGDQGGCNKMLLLLEEGTILATQSFLIQLHDSRIDYLQYRLLAMLQAMHVQR